MSTEMAAMMAKTRRESIRWYLMVALNVARPAGAQVPMLLAVIQGTYADATEREVRIELDYLGDRKLIDIDKRPDGRWLCELNRLGVDFVEYTIKAEPGIARPEHPGV